MADEIGIWREAGCEGHRVKGGPECGDRHTFMTERLNKALLSLTKGFME